MFYCWSNTIFCTILNTISVFCHQVVSNISGGMPSREEVTYKCDQVTKRLQELWSGVRPHTSYSPCAEAIVSAVSTLSASFPQVSGRSLLFLLLMIVKLLQNNTLMQISFCTKKVILVG